MQDAPAAVRIPGAQTLPTGSVLLTRLDGNLGNLKAHGEVRVTAWQDKYSAHTQGSCVCVRSLGHKQQQTSYQILTYCTRYTKQTAAMLKQDDSIS